jgi:rhamnosyl/mannosyltransferase
MKILQLGKFYPIQGGVEKVMYDLVDGLSKRSIHCDMLCASSTNKTQIIPLNYCCKIICMATFAKVFNTMISPLMILKLWRIKKNYDIIHIHHPDPMAALVFLMSAYKGIVILHWHGDIFKQKLMLKLFLPLQKWLINRANIIVGTTPIYVQCSPFLQKVQQKTICIPIGIDKVSLGKDTINEIRKNYVDKKIIFSLGRLVEYKGFGYLIEAAKYLTDEYVILIGGEGKLKEELFFKIKKDELQNKVKLLGHIPSTDLPSYYTACDLFCLSSIWKTEAFGIVQIEAMSCGKPIVATNIKGSGVSWVNMHNVTGINVVTANSKELADAIIYLLSNPIRYEKFSNAALKRYNELFRKEIMINKCIDLYKSLL